MKGSIKRVLYAGAIVLTLAGLMAAARIFGPASFVVHAQSTTDQAVIAARNALTQARADEQANPNKDTTSATTDALSAYKVAVDARLTAISVRLDELHALVSQGQGTGATQSEIAALEQEAGELQASLQEDYAGGLSTSSASSTMRTRKLSAASLTAASTPVTSAFCNTNPINFVNSAAVPTASNPYPSTINVSGLTGLVTKATLTLNNLNHTFPDDIDILLVGPGGQNAIVMSDAGGSTDAINLTITFDDAAALSLPDAGALTSGTFKPTNFAPADAFPPPAPLPSGGSALSVFNSTNPNGTWSLYVVDDTLGDTGSISGGWCLTLTTEEGVPCTIICPPDITQPNDVGQCGAVVSYPAPTTTGTCGTVTCSPPSGAFYPVGTTTVTCTTAAGSSCSFTITVISATCQTPSGCNAGQITFINSPAVPTAASPYPSTIGISGLVGSVTKVTVTLNRLNHTFPDDVDILLVGPGGQNAIIMSDAGGGPDAVNLTLTFDDAAATSLPDSTALTSGTFKPTNFAPADSFPSPAPAPSGGSALSVFNGTNPNGTWSLYVVDDTLGDSGNIASGWCLNITTDGIPPCAITCPANITTSNDPNQCGAVVSYPAPSVTGNCGTVICAPAAGSFFPKGTTTVTCTTTSGPSCSFTVTVNDTQPPSITCPANVTQSTDPNSCSATVIYPAPVATDNCPGVTVACTPASGSSFSEGTTTVTCTATDSSGNTASCSFTVTVNDTQAPTIGACPANITRSTDADVCTAVVTYATPTATDNCTANPVVTCTPASGSAFSKGTTTVTCTATDGSGNTASCSFTVTVNDTQPPSITCPANKTQSTDTNACTAVVNYSNATATDNCPNVGTPSCTPSSGSAFPKGTTTVTCTASDESGNTATCSFTVTVNDTQPPSITCPANITRPNDPNQCGATVNYSSPTVSDNCPGVGTPTCNHASGSFFPTGTTTVTCTVTDASGNPNSCSFTVTVNDTQPPAISCPANISTIADPGVCSAIVTFTVGASDNCPGVTVVANPPSGSAFPIGTTTVTATATDASGNTATCMFTVTVTNPNPVVTITSPPSGSLYPVGSSVNFMATFTDAGGGTHTGTWTFTSSSLTLTQSATIVEPSGSTPGTANASFTFNSTGVYLVKLTVNDSCGGTGTADTVDGLTAMVVIYDPDGGFVTGGGWINSPPGAYVANPTLTGKASFGFVSKYHHGASVPSGDTEFQFRAANFNFKSTSYDWLVIAGARAQYKGSGTVNGSGNYGFMLTAIDGQVSGGGGTDKFRIKIWDKNNGNAIVYDNQMSAPDSSDPTTVLGGGSIVIHN